MHIAIVGSGIAGNAVAYGLSMSGTSQITVYERENRAGGHSATVDIDYDGHPIAVDTGFIVYNELNYPNFTALLSELGVATQASNMSFALCAQGGAFEWSGRTTDVFNGLFAQRSNLLSPRYWRMLMEIGRFNRLAVADRAGGRLGDLTLAAYLDKRGFSTAFRDAYLVPMGAAIWSMSFDAMMAFPAQSFIAFFENHHLLQWNRPVWRTVTGGSRTYVNAMQRGFRDRVRLSTGVTQVRRHATGVEITDMSGATAQYDQVVFASHSDETLAMLADASAQEAALLGAVRYRPNDVYLHRDPRLMPQRKRAWASWNVIAGADRNADLCVTYWMNALQGIERSRPLLITLNPPAPPSPELTFARFNYAHPQYDSAAIAAQKALGLIQGRNRSWYCGAWTAYGFHEDGLTSGIAVSEALGGSFGWRKTSPPRAEAAA